MVRDCHNETSSVICKGLIDIHVREVVLLS